MSIFDWANDRIGRLTWVDLGLTKFCVAAFALMVAKLWPPLLSLEWYWYGLIFVVLAAIPLKKFLS
ncbi:MAG: hypothetical protein A4E49_00315 [Methanosaeta sp. PtaU1.Bin112]|nr:MAG: hypothetical protein A4E49_00315 [Methanosaeta sp. PtaU1.Bin112]